MKDALEEIRSRIEAIERQVGILPKAWEVKLVPANKKAPAKK